MTMAAPVTPSAPLSLSRHRAALSRALLTRRHLAGALYGVIVGSIFTASAVGVGAATAFALCGG